MYYIVTRMANGEYLPVYEDDITKETQIISMSVNSKDIMEENKYYRNRFEFKIFQGQCILEDVLNIQKGRVICASPTQEGIDEFLKKLVFIEELEK